MKQYKTKYGLAILDDFFNVELKDISTILTDIPYLAIKNQIKKPGVIGAFYDIQKFSDFSKRLSVKFAKITNDNPNILIFAGTHGECITHKQMLMAKFVWMTTIAWRITNPFPSDVLRKNIKIPAGGWEPILWYCKKQEPPYFDKEAWQKSSEAGRCLNVINAGVGSHYAGKSISLMKLLVGAFANPIKVVLDPFAGQLTTGIACERMHVPWICIEKNKEQFDKGVERIKKKGY